jgi:hypothetical protein
MEKISLRFCLLANLLVRERHNVLFLLRFQLEKVKIGLSLVPFVVRNLWLLDTTIFAIVVVCISPNVLA